MLTLKQLRVVNDLMLTVVQVTQELAGEIDQQSQYAIIEQLKVLAGITQELGEQIGVYVEIEIAESKLLPKNKDDSSEATT